jgi:integrase
VKEWIKQAGITQKITFHCFRHTYASLQIELGTDRYTVQKLLAHRSIGTTEIYTRHADPKKREAADKICLGMLKDDSGTKKGGKKKKS